MDLVADFQARTRAALGGLAERGILPGGFAPSGFAVAPAAAAHGCDLVTNAALVHGDAHRRGAPALAADLARALGEDPDVAHAVATDVGFVNVTLHDRVTASALSAVLSRGGAFGRGAPAPPVAVVAGPPGPSAVLRWVRVAVVADALARLLAFAGHDVAFACEAGSAAAEEELGALAVAAGRSGPLRPGAAARVEVGEARPRAPSPGPSDGRTVIAVAPCRLTGAAGAGRPWSPASPGELARALEVDALRFALLARRSDRALDLDPAAMGERSQAVPAFAVRYAHARARKVLRDAGVAMPDLDLSPAALAGGDFTLLSDAGEVEIRRLVLGFPHAVAAAAAAHAPHRVADLLRDLAGAVHRQWNRSKDQPQLRFVNEERRDLTEARLGLVAASTIVLRSGLGILGVTAPEEML